MEKLTREFLLEAILKWYANPENPKKKFAHRSATRALESKTPGQLLFVVCDMFGISLHTLARESGVSVSKIGEYSRGLPLEDAESIRIRKFLSVNVN